MNLLRQEMELYPNYNYVQHAHVTKMTPGRRVIDFFVFSTPWVEDSKGDVAKMIDAFKLNVPHTIYDLLYIIHLIKYTVSFVFQIVTMLACCVI